MKYHMPSFWFKKNSTASQLLSPLSMLYQLGYRLRYHSTQPYKSSVPVICVGNITVGGSGKTPVVRALISLLKQKNIAKNPCILSRGYGGSKDMIFVNSADHTYLDTGDEPLLLAKDFPVFIAKSRVEGSKAIIKAGYDMIIMDDGFQNPSLKKTFSFLVIDGKGGLGNGLCIPAGPLREQLSEGLKRTDAVIIIGQDRHNMAQQIPKTLPVITGSIRSDFEVDKAQKYIAFCGLGRPEKFQETLHDLGAKIIEFMPFPDHYPYTKTNIQNLISRAIQNEARLVTTEKDAVRLKAFPEIQALLDIVPITLNFESPEAIETALRKKGFGS